MACRRAARREAQMSPTHMSFVASRAVASSLLALRAVLVELPIGIRSPRKVSHGFTAMPLRLAARDCHHAATGSPPPLVAPPSPAPRWAMSSDADRDLGPGGVAFARLWWTPVPDSCGARPDLPDLGGLGVGPAWALAHPTLVGPGARRGPA